MGRTQTPETLKLIKSTRRKDRKKKHVSDDVIWDSPIELTPEEITRRDQIATYLKEKNAFKSIHSTGLSMLVKCESIMAMSANQIKNETDLIQYFPNGTSNISPAMTALKQSLSGFMNLAEQFGATPKASQSISALNDGQMKLEFPGMQESPIRQAR